MFRINTERGDRRSLKDNMKIVYKIILGILNLIYGIMKLFRVKDRITFISRQSNEKSEDMQLLQRELRRQMPGTEQIFLCRRLDSGIGAKLKYCFHVLKQMRYTATSKVVVLDSYCISVSALRQRKSLVVIQMWHALGSLKKFGLSIVGEGEGRDKDIAEIFAMHRNYTYVLTSSRECVPHFAEAFGYEEERVKVLSLPRVDKLTSWEVKEDALRRIYTEYPRFREKKVVVYAPTLRVDRDISAETAALAAAFSSPEYIFVVKKHPLTEMSFEPAGNCIIDDRFTTLEMLFAADAVICDYSAVIFEAAVIGKPMFFYTFDFDTYGAERDFYIDYMKEMPGVISPDPEELEKAVADNRYDLRRIRDFAHKYVENQENCTKKLAAFIKEQSGRQ